MAIEPEIGLEQDAHSHVKGDGRCWNLVRATWWPGPCKAVLNGAGCGVGSIRGAAGCCAAVAAAASGAVALTGARLGCSAWRCVSPGIVTLSGRTTTCMAGRMSAFTTWNRDSLFWLCKHITMHRLGTLLHSVSTVIIHRVFPSKIVAL